jgi:protein subunit release factor A
MSESVIVEVRGAEGGDDAKQIVLEQVKIYLRLCARRTL